jgi:hypothetical protein
MNIIEEINLIEKCRAIAKANPPRWILGEIQEKRDLTRSNRAIIASRYIPSNN